MKKEKRTLGILLVSVVFGLLLTGCRSHPSADLGQQMLGAITETLTQAPMAERRESPQAVQAPMAVHSPPSVVQRLTGQTAVDSVTLQPANQLEGSVTLQPTNKPLGVVTLLPATAALQPAGQARAFVVQQPPARDTAPVTDALIQEHIVEADETATEEPSRGLFRRVTSIIFR